jgi:hypothetical protein
MHTPMYQTPTVPVYVYPQPLGTDSQYAAKQRQNPTHQVVIYPLVSRVHLDKRIPHDVLYEWADVDLSQDKAERVCRGVAEEDEAVACLSLVEMQFVLRSRVRREGFFSD